ncbi:efflux RND transporter periplasmic adaptor subunit [Geminicoccus roseus]|uniref:efflux RND transporter periplasmic adaptor subunit n=1 Tax=Geminicoccus roseus TaxID=404900 RepID=UPI002AC3637B|nr:efflux RND transporter periplasmic adaptor subunit [Geminicoccus roseus]
MTRSPATLARTVLTAVLVAWGSAAAAEAPEPAAGVVAPTVTVVTAAERELVAQIVVTGTLAARDEVLVGPEIDGSRIVELLVEEGDRVAKGQVLVRLSRDLWDAQLASIDAMLARAEVSVAVAQSQVDEAAAAAAQAQADFERAQALARRGNTSEAILDEREAAASSARARVATAQQSVRLAEAQVAEARAKRTEIMVQIGMTEIRAPAAGRISERRARLGALAAMNGEPLFRIIKDNEIELQAQVAETMLATLEPGQPVNITPTGRDHAIPGEIRLITPQIDPQTRLGKVKISLESSEGLTLGTFARGRIEIAREEGVVVPISAVQFAPRHQEVQVVQDGQVETRIVTLGLRTNEAALIESGLEAGEKIVAVSGTFLRDGDKVRPVEVEDPTVPLAGGTEVSVKS